MKEPVYTNSDTAEQKREISSLISSSFDHVIQRGLFKGMKLCDQQFWGQGEKANKILGIYEYEVQRLIERISKAHSIYTLIDIGGADGFYAVGALFSKLVNRVITYEQSALGRESIREHAKLNSIDDGLQINPSASSHVIMSLLSEKNVVPPLLIIIDIEGHEYDLLSRALLEKMRHCHVIIEIHDRFIKDKTAKEVALPFRDFSLSQEMLFKSANQTHKVHVIPECKKDISEFKIFDGWSSYSKALLTSESRICPGIWWYLEPIEC